MLEHYCIQTNTLSLADNIALLYNLNVFDEEMFNKLDIIRKSGNKAVHDKLNNKQKQKFMDCLNNSDLYADAISTDLKPGESRSFADGDVVIEMTAKDEVPKNTPSAKLLSGSLIIPAAAATTTIKTTYKKTVTLFGVKVFQVTCWIIWQHNGTKITKILDSNHYTSINWNPTLVITWQGSPTRWIDGTRKAYSTQDMSASLFIEGYGTTFISGTSGVYGYLNGTSGGWFNE